MSAPPAWLKTFNSHLPKSSGYTPTFTLSTLRPSGAPTARTCVYRGTLFSLPPNPRNVLRGLNPDSDTLSSCLLTFTTDARMSKVLEITTDRRVEACFWFEDCPEKSQWRFSGQCDFFSYNGDTPSEKLARWKLRRDIFGVREGEEVGGETFVTGMGEEVSWRREVLRQFANLGPGMRGTFANPAPGTGMKGGEGEEKLGRKILDEWLRKEFLGEESEESSEGWEEKRKVLMEGLKNFRLGVIKVEKIDRVDLAAKEGKGRRWKIERVGESNWKEEEVWP